MRKTIAALFVTAALVGSTGALADHWQGNGNDHHGNGGQSSSSQGGNGQGGNGQGGNGQSHSEFHTQSQNGGSGDHHWGARSFSNVQAGSNISGGHNFQGGNGAQVQVESGEHHWNGGSNDHSQWNGNDGGNAKHYHWNDGDHGDHGDHDQWRHGDRDNHNWDHHDWNRGNWNRGEWQIFRDQNRARFHLPRYNGPRGYSYRRFDRGYRIDPFFYSQQYWIDDPYEYQLPPAYGPFRWVRYYNDALLVNIYTGEVEDVIYDFFW